MLDSYRIKDRLYTLCMHIKYWITDKLWWRSSTQTLYRPRLNNPACVQTIKFFSNFIYNIDNFVLSEKKSNSSLTNTPTRTCEVWRNPMPSTSWKTSSIWTMPRRRVCSTHLIKTRTRSWVYGSSSSSTRPSGMGMSQNVQLPENIAWPESGSEIYFIYTCTNKILNASC